MDAAEHAQREAVVREALSYCGTRYHHGADVKQAGVDCAMLLVRCFVDSGVLPAFDPRPYSPQWSLNECGEQYVEFVEKLAGEVCAPPGRVPFPADLVLFRHAGISSYFAHAGIVTRWPQVVHCMMPRCELANANVHPLGGHARRFFSVWEARQ